MTLKTAAIILAAGKGTRMKATLPKVMHPLMGKPLLIHVIDHAKAFAADQILTVLSPDLKAVLDLTQKSETVVQEHPKGSGHAVQQALPSLLPDVDIVFVLAGDVPALRPESLTQACDAFMENPDLQALVLAMDVPYPNSYGRLIVESERLQRIVETKDATLDEKKITLCNSGILAFRAPALQQACTFLKPSSISGEYYITDVIEIIQKNGGFVGYRVIDADEAQGVNTQADLAMLEDILQQRYRHALLLKGVRMPAPQTVYFSHDTKIAPDVVIEPNVVFGPKVCIEAFSVIHSFSYLEGCHIKERATVGPFARLRPGTIMETDSKVGNFVEIKNTTLGAHSKASHLTYLGDTTVGTKTNIGAGTVTCNYDGFQKSKTTLGNGVFIGSNTALVAPITIADGAVVGAGSTLTKDVPAQALAIARTKQIILEQGAVKIRNKQQKISQR